MSSSNHDLPISLTQGKDNERESLKSDDAVESPPSQKKRENDEEEQESEDDDWERTLEEKEDWQLVKNLGRTLKVLQVHEKDKGEASSPPTQHTSLDSPCTLLLGMGNSLVEDEEKLWKYMESMAKQYHSFMGDEEDEDDDDKNEDERMLPTTY
uniref:Uncharacterized protein n=1 Tax=Marseillevirus LCMAC101 TaxID=2506602 RepID=A0A481YTZ7_9VIRU|nr:MAG: hypothetical protein LCMAC101_05710 [Marseillevirus LCMAC101]